MSQRSVYTYEAAWKVFDDARDAYRAGTMSDDEYLAARAAFKAAETEADEALAVLEAE